MLTMDFSLARSNHQLWNMKLRSFLRGKEDLTAKEAGSHTSCDLGRWLYATGLTEYGAIPEMQQLERVHVDLHITVRKIVKLYHTGDTAQAQETFAEIAPLSDEVVALLGVIEQKVKD